MFARRHRLSKLESTVSGRNKNYPRNNYPGLGLEGIRVPSFSTSRRVYVMNKEQRAAWRKANPELHRVEQRAYYARYSEKVRKRCKKYKQENPEIVKTHRLVRYARERASGSFTSAEWFTLCFACGFICLSCKQRKPLTPDHVVPVSGGGSSFLHNIQPLCGLCNNKKHTKTIDYRSEQSSQVCGLECTFVLSPKDL